MIDKQYKYLLLDLDGTITDSMEGITRSVQYALANRTEALHYAMSFARDMDEATADKFVTMYVNDLTVDCGERGREAVRLFFQKAFDTGIYEELIVPEFVI